MASGQSASPQCEGLVPWPWLRAAWLQPEQALHPADVGFGAAAAELPVEVDPLNHGAVRGTGLLDASHGPDLVRPDTLVLIDQEHRHPGRPHQLI
jgi:hypothetical protein